MQAINNSNLQANHQHVSQDCPIRSLPPELLLHTFGYFTKKEDQRNLSLTCRRFRSLSAPACLNAAKLFADTGQAQHLAFLCSQHRQYYTSHNANVGQKLAKTFAMKLPLLRQLLDSDKPRENDLGAWIFSHSFPASNSTGLANFLKDSPGPLGTLLREFQAITKQAKENPSIAINWNKVNEFLDVFYRTTSLVFRVLTPSTERRGMITDDLKALLQHFDAGESPTYPLIAFTKAILCDGMTLLKVVENEVIIPPHKRLLVAAVTQYGKLYSHLPDCFKSDLEIIHAGILANPNVVVRHIPKEIWKTRKYHRNI